MNEKLEEVRKRNIRFRKSIKDAFKSNPAAMTALGSMFNHSAERIRKADERQSLVMLGQLEVFQTIKRATEIEEDE